MFFVSSHLEAHKNITLAHKATHDDNCMVKTFFHTEKKCLGEHPSAADISNIFICVVGTHSLFSSIVNTFLCPRIYFLSLEVLR